MKTPQGGVYIQMKTGRIDEISDEWERRTYAEAFEYLILLLRTAESKVSSKVRGSLIKNFWLGCPSIRRGVSPMYPKNKQVAFTRFHTAL